MTINASKDVIRGYLEISNAEIFILIYYVHYVVDVDECVSSPCQNGGNCTDAVNGYTCVCVEGYTSNNCETSRSTYTILLIHILFF